MNEQLPQPVSDYLIYKMPEMVKRLKLPPQYCNSTSNVGMFISFMLGEVFYWEKWRKEIPFIRFDADWDVRIIPPFNGAIVRFYVKKGERSVSVYLDCYDTLGYMQKPYWEIYPFEDDVHRVEMDNVQELTEKIREELNRL